MYIKYLKYLAAPHWAKAAVPLLFIGVALFLQGTIESQVQQHIGKKVVISKSKLGSDLGSENNAFAQALKSDKDLSEIKPINYKEYANREFIKGQKNDITLTEESQKSTGGVEEVVPVIPPEPTYYVSSIFVGRMKSFAVVNQKVVRIGDTLSSGETVAGIEDGRILLKGRWGDRWLYINY